MKVPPHLRLRNSAIKRSRELNHWLGAHFMKRTGVSGYSGRPELVVSLTTIPERIRTIHLCLDSLLRQSLKPDRIVLWLNRTDAGGRPRLAPERLPESLRRLQRRGLTIEWCENFGPHTKLLPALRRFPWARIATADDDILYPRDWLETLAWAKEAEPQFIHCHRAHRMRFDPAGRILGYSDWERRVPGGGEAALDLFPTGVGGVLYAPGDLSPEVFNVEALRELCPKADDVWFRAMSLLRGKRCKVVPRSPFKEYQCELKVSRRGGLRRGNVAGGGNDRQIAAVAERYGVFRRELSQPVALQP